MEKNILQTDFEGKNSCSEIPSEKKKTYTEQTIFHGEKCWKKILGWAACKRTQQLPTLLVQQCYVRLHGALHL